MRTLLVLLAGEIKLQLRQPVAIILLFLLPLLLVPGALLSLQWYVSSVDEGAAPVSSSPPRELAVIADAPFAQWVQESDRLRILEAGAPQGSQKDSAARVRLKGNAVHVEFRADSADGRKALERIKRVVKRHDRETFDRALAEAGRPLQSRDVLVVEVTDRADRHRRGGDRIGALLPGLLGFLVLVGALYTALDVVSGEKERGTIETLLSTAVDRQWVVTAKGAVTALAGLVPGVIGLLAVFALSRSGLDLAVVLGEEGGRALTLGPLLWVTGALALLAVQMAAVMLVVAAWAPDYRTGSMLSAPVILVLMGPLAVGAWPDLSLSAPLALVPFANVSLACRELLAGELAPGLGLTVLAATAVHAGLLGRWAWLLLCREGSLIGGSGAPRSEEDHRISAALLWITAMLLFWFVGQLAQSIHLVAGHLLTQLGLFAAVAFAGVAILGVPLVETMSLRPPRLLDLGLGIVAGLTLPAVGLLALFLQAPLLPLPGSVEQAMRQILGSDDQPFWVALVLFAVLPGICEELFYRGALLGLLRGSVRPLPRVCLVGALFGLNHLLLPRLLPTGLLGVAIGAAVLRSRSLWVGMVMHTLNNAMGVAMVHRWAEAEPEPGWGAVLGGCAVCAGAIAAMGVLQRRRDSTR